MPDDARLAKRAPRRSSTLGEVGQADLTLGIEAGRTAICGFREQFRQHVEVLRVLSGKLTHHIVMLLLERGYRVPAGLSPGVGKRQQMER